MKHTTFSVDVAKNVSRSPFPTRRESFVKPATAHGRRPRRIRP